MNKLTIVLSVVLAWCCVGVLFVNYRLTERIGALELENIRTSEDVIYLVSNDNYLEFESIRANKHISILEQSISPRDMRWAKIKQVRSTIQKDLENAGFASRYTINDITAIAGSIIDYSEQYDVSISLIAAIMRTESAYNPLAISPTGAQGLMQIVPSTAEEVANDIGKKHYNIFKISDNIQLGTWYLWKMLKRFHGDESLAIRAYNCGPQYVEKVQANIYPDYPDETKKYLELVVLRKKAFEDMGL